MAKIILWKNREKTFKLTPQHIEWLEQHNATIPNACGEYDNGDQILIESVEAMRAMALQNLRDEYNLYADLQGKKIHFSQCLNNFEAFVAKFWFELLSANPDMIGSPQLDTFFNSMMYGIQSWKDFQDICLSMNLILPHQAEQKYSALIRRREAIQELRAKQDAAHDKYIKFCASVGMRAFSHVPSINGFEVVEYDETKFIAHVTTTCDMKGYKWEELTLESR